MNHPRNTFALLERRQFLGKLAASASGAASIFAVQPFSLLAAEPGGGELRLIAYNILACTGWPADRPLAQRAAATGQVARRIALELALYDPHVVTFSESPDERLTREIAEQLGMHHVRFPSGEDWPGTLLSKFEVLESRNAPVASGERPADLFTRHWGRAKLRLPSGKPLIVHSAHLYPGQDPAIRLREIEAMLLAMRGDLESGSPLILMGDLNHFPDGAEYAKWKQAGLVDTFAAANSDSKGAAGAGLTYPADTPKIRIDYVWVGGPLAKSSKASHPLWVGAFRTNPADAQSFALSDHIPQYAAFSLAE